MALSRSYSRSAALRILSLTRGGQTRPVALQPASNLDRSRPKLSLAPCTEPMSCGTTSKPGEGCSTMACRRMYHGAIGQAVTPPCIVMSSRAAETVTPHLPSVRFSRRVRSVANRMLWNMRPNPAHTRAAAPKQYIWRSLKTSNEQTVVDLGRRLLFQLEQRAEVGIPPKSKLFSAVINDYIRHRERNHRHGGTSAGMLRQIIRANLSPDARRPSLWLGRTV